MGNDKLKKVSVLSERNIYGNLLPAWSRWIYALRMIMLSQDIQEQKCERKDFLWLC